MRLYQIPLAYRQLDELAEAGEDVSAALATLEGELVDKCEAVVSLLRNLDADAEAYSAEIKRLSERKRVAENNAERIKGYLRSAMADARIHKIRAGTFSVSLSDGPDRIEVDDVDALPEEFTRIKREPNKTALLAHYRETGEVVEGTKVERGTRLVIR